MSFHLMPDLEPELVMIDLKHSLIMMEMVTLTINMTEDGKHLPKKRLPHLLLHRTQNIPTSFHLMLDPELE